VNTTLQSTSSSRGIRRSSAEDFPEVYVVDDDEGIRAALRRLFFSEGIRAVLYDSGANFLESARFEHSGCLILDVRMPGMNGLEVQAELARRAVDIPTIFLTGASDVPIAVAAMRSGAVDFIEKPFENEYLLARVRQAIFRHQRQRLDDQERRDINSRFEVLTPREREVLDLVVSGQTSKEIARTLGASHRTIEIHRNHLMEKTGADSLADLIRLRLIERSRP
jgi:two-component system, LuxR family, response regulator FixJ